MELNNLGKKVGYIKGLMEGMEFSDPAQEKLLCAMADLLGELSDQVCDIDDMLEELNDYVESIDDDLADLEVNRDDGFSLLDDDDDEFEDEDYMDELDSGADSLRLIGGSDLPADSPADDEQDALAGAVCPDCEHMFFVNAADAPDALYICPHCGHKVTPVPLTPENAPIAKPAEEE